MAEVPTSWLEEAILQLLREKGRLEKKNDKLDPRKKQEWLASINIELKMMVDRYTERTGKTLDDFLNERKEGIAQEREKNKFYYI